MDAKSAKTVSVDPRASRVLEYAAYVYCLVAAGLFYYGQYLAGALLLGAAILQYQVSQYRQVIHTLQGELADSGGRTD